MENKNRRQMVLNALNDLKYWIEQVAGVMDDKAWEEAVIETEIESFQNRIDVIYNTEGDEA